MTFLKQCKWKSLGEQQFVTVPTYQALSAKCSVEKQKDSCHEFLLTLGYDKEQQLGEMQPAWNWEDKLESNEQIIHNK